MDRFEFINTVIGEGSEKMLREIFNDDTTYEKLIALETEKFEGVIVKNLNKMSAEQLTNIAYGYDIKVFE